MSADEWAWEQNLDCDSTSAQVVVDILNTLLARPEPPKALLARCYVFRIRQVAAERAPISCQLVEDLVQLDEIADPEADPDELPHIVDAASLAPSGEVAALVSSIYASRVPRTARPCQICCRTATPEGRAASRSASPKHSRPCRRWRAHLIFFCTGSWAGSW